MQSSSSLPDIPLQDDEGTKSSSTSSSNINNQSNSTGGKHIVLALENYNQIDDAMGKESESKSSENNQIAKKKIKLNIDPTSSSSASSVNLDDLIVTENSTL